MRTLSTLMALALLMGCANLESGPYAQWHDADAWLTDPDSGCKINREFEGLGRELRWDGECPDGFAIGLGRLTFIDDQGQPGYWRTCLFPEDRRANCYTGGGFGNH